MSGFPSLNRDTTRANVAVVVVAVVVVVVVVVVGVVGGRRHFGLFSSQA